MLFGIDCPRFPLVRRLQQISLLNLIVLFPISPLHSLRTSSASLLLFLWESHSCVRAVKGHLQPYSWPICATPDTRYFLAWTFPEEYCCIMLLAPRIQNIPLHLASLYPNKVSFQVFPEDLVPQSLNWAFILKQHLHKLQSPEKNQGRGITEQRIGTVNLQRCTQKGELPLPGGPEARAHTPQHSQNSTLSSHFSTLCLVCPNTAMVYLSILGLYHFLSSVWTQ